MCGIGGIVLRQGRVDQSTLDAMAAALAHRGPDDSGEFIHDGIALLHRRLSIIDLAHGHQPLQSADNNLTLVANGEIYNDLELRAQWRDGDYRTRSDCESILEAYRRHGLDCLQHLIGMFAFALYDRRNDRLLLARDRLGIKPLFLAHTDQGIAFASEMKALLPCLPQREINPHGLIGYLHQQFHTGAETIWKNVERVAPGEALIIEQGQITRRWRYWDSHAVQPRAMSLPEAVERFDGLMETVIKQHMRADVPFGLFLSGGVDSGILMALLSRHHNHPIRTYSVGFPGTRTTDELPLARVVAERFGSEHVEITPSAEDLFHHLPHTLWAADDLMRDYAVLPSSLLSQRAAKDLKVVFSGEGGDEVFAGYRRFGRSGLQRWLKGLADPAAGGFRKRGALKRGDISNLLGPELAHVFGHVRDDFATAWRDAPRHWSRLQRLQWSELRTALPDNLMVKLDRMTMAWGLEGRVPLLDHRIVELGLSLPDELKVHQGMGKYVLKQWARPWLTHDQLYGRKRGFHVPIGEWLSGDFLERLAPALTRHEAIRTWFQPEGVKRLLTAQIAKPGSATRPLFALLQFAIWYQIFVIGKGERPPLHIDPVEFLS